MTIIASKPGVVLLRPNKRGRVVMVTGCTRGIGRALLESFCKDDSIRKVIGIGKEHDAIEELKKSVMYEVSIHKLNLFNLDVEDSKAVDHLANDLRDQGIIPDLLVNNSGIFGPPKPALDSNTADINRPTIQTNVIGAYNCIKSFMPLMLSNHEVKVSVIVNITGEAGRSAFPTLGPCSLSQFALEGLTVSVAQDIFPHQNASIVSVNPGMVCSDMLIEYLGEKEAKKIGTPLHHWQKTFPDCLLSLNKSHSGRQLSWPDDVESLTGFRAGHIESLKPDLLEALTVETILTPSTQSDPHHHDSGFMSPLVGYPILGGKPLIM